MFVCLFVSSPQSESWLCQQNQKLEREKQFLQEQKVTFKNERKNFTEAVIKFGEQVSCKR